MKPIRFVAALTATVASVAFVGIPAFASVDEPGTAQIESFAKSNIEEQLAEVSGTPPSEVNGVTESQEVDADDVDLDPDTSTKPPTVDSAKKPKEDGEDDPVTDVHEQPEGAHGNEVVETNSAEVTPAPKQVDLDDVAGTGVFADLAGDTEGHGLDGTEQVPQTKPLTRRIQLPTSGFQRFSGKNRYGTSVAVANHLCANGCDKVYIASGTAYPDAITISALAVSDEAAVLLVGQNRVPDDVAHALQTRIKPKEITIAGGAGVVSNQVANQLKKLTGVTPTRLSGINRYATARQIAMEQNRINIQNAPETKELFLTTGKNWPDALAASPVAGLKDAPIVLSGQNQLEDNSRRALKELRPDVVHIVGGKWSQAVRNEISSLTGGAKIQVHSGKDRFETAVRLAENNYARPTTAVYVTGLDFADAISGSVLAAAADTPLLLARNNCRSPQTATYAATAKGGAFVGGTGAIRATAATTTCQAVPGWITQLRAILDNVGGAHVGLAQAGPNNCSADACSNSNGTIYVRPPLANYSVAGKYWAMTHELAHQYQFAVWNNLMNSRGYSNLFGRDIEYLANCMAAERGHGGGTVCSKAQLNYAASIWAGRVP